MSRRKQQRPLRCATPKIVVESSSSKKESNISVTKKKLNNLEMKITADCQLESANSGEPTNPLTKLKEQVRTLEEKLTFPRFELSNIQLNESNNTFLPNKKTLSFVYEPDSTFYANHRITENKIKSKKLVKNRQSIADHKRIKSIEQKRPKVIINSQTEISTSTNLQASNSKNVLKELSTFVEKVGNQSTSSFVHINDVKPTSAKNGTNIRCAKSYDLLDKLAQHKHIHRHFGHKNAYQYCSHVEATAQTNLKNYIEQLRKMLMHNDKRVESTGLPFFSLQKQSNVLGNQKEKRSIAIGRRGHFGFRCNLCGFMSMNVPVAVHMTSAHSFRNGIEWKEAVSLIPFR